MSTDSTELTFVRCPSCRSLVPAMSTRCRMCGSQLDASSEAEETEGKDKPVSSRVRQRTMTQPREDLAATVKKLREDVSSEKVNEVEASGSSKLEAGESAEGALSDDDPLSAYIEEVEEEIESEAEDDLFDSDDYTDSDSEDENEDEPEDDLDVDDEPDETYEDKKSHSENNGASASKQAAKAGGSPRVIVESGNRRQGGGLSFGKKKEAETSSREPVQMKVAADKEPAGKKELLEESKKASSARGSSPAVERPAMRDKDREDKKSSDRGTEKSARDNPGADRIPSQKTHSSFQSSVAKRSKSNHGMLFGWMVSYVKPEGEAIELREGKFFVTASSLKKSDLVLEDESVSTPHAMVTVSEDNGLQIQDLMSDRGFYVKRRKSSSFEQEEDVTVINHGDRIKFGEVEFLVSLIAHVGEK